MTSYTELVRVPEHILAEARELVDWMGATTADLPFPSTDRFKAAATCFAIVQEHHDSIVVLAEHRLFATCFALVRVAFDAYVRGVWLSLCASEEWVRRFIALEDPPNMVDLLKAIEKHPDFEDGHLSRYKAAAYKALCDLTHTGGRQVRQWDKGNAIEPDYRVEEILEAIHVSQSFAMLSVLGVITLVDDTDIALAAIAEFEAVRRRYIPMPTDQPVTSA